MILFNKTNGTNIVDDVCVLKTFYQKSKGLIYESTPHSIFFKTRWGIHSFGVRFPIDVVICDTKMRVAVLREKFLPNRMFFWSPRFFNVFELPSETIKKSNIKIGDILEIVNV